MLHGGWPRESFDVLNSILCRCATVSGPRVHLLPRWSLTCRVFEARRVGHPHPCLGLLAMACCLMWSVGRFPSPLWFSFRWCGEAGRLPDGPATPADKRKSSKERRTSASKQKALLGSRRVGEGPMLTRSHQTVRSPQFRARTFRKCEDLSDRATSWPLLIALALPGLSIFRTAFRECVLCRASGVVQPLPHLRQAGRASSLPH